MLAFKTKKNSHLNKGWAGSELKPLMTFEVQDPVPPIQYSKPRYWLDTQKEAWP